MISDASSDKYSGDKHNWMLHWALVYRMHVWIYIAWWS